MSDPIEYKPLANFAVGPASSPLEAAPEHPDAKFGREVARIVREVHAAAPREVSGESEPKKIDLMDALKKSLAQTAAERIAELEAEVRRLTDENERIASLYKRVLAALRAGAWEEAKNLGGSDA